MKEDYPIVDENIYDLKCFEHTIVSISGHISYQLMRVPGGWIWNDSTFIPFDPEFILDFSKLSSK